ncbi:MAG TPA: flavin reductase family protein [Pseudogracilibacillus sp.]|nr:flavin reductase family protein [Pseudogracilibacillus sp.]
MISINPEDQKERDNYKLLIGSIIPRPIAFVTSETKDGTVNGAPFSYFNIVTANPPMISISVQRKNGIHKDTARNIIEKQEFVVHIVDEDNVEKINETAANLSPNESEIKRAQLNTVPSEVVQTPGVKEAKVRYECQLEKVVELGGEDDEVGTDLIIGKIVRVHLDESVYDDGKIVYRELNAVSRLAGNDYAKIGDIFSIERPQ